MRGSLRQLDYRRTLEGWVVLKGTKIELALNYGPTIFGRDWGFDWINRATVFKDKTAACEALKFIENEDTRRQARVVSVESVATLQPRVNKQGRIVWYAGDEKCPLKLKDYAYNWVQESKKKEEEAQALLDWSKAHS